MNNLKYFVGVLMVGTLLIMSLGLNVSAIPQVSIGNVTHVFTVVPGQPADITLPIMIKNINASDPYGTFKGLQFNVTYNCSMINITNITDVKIVDVPEAPPMREIYDKLCNESSMPRGLRSVFCFYMNRTVLVGGVNRTNASILIATIRNTTHPDICVLRIAFASYKNLTASATIGRIKMSVKPLENYFARNYNLSMNITVERMGLNRTVYINVTNATIHSQAKMDGLIKACRGDATEDGQVTTVDGSWIYRFRLHPTSPLYINLTKISGCLDVDGDGQVTTVDGSWIYRFRLHPTSPLYINISNYTAY